MDTAVSFSLRELALLSNKYDPTSPGYNNGVRSAALAGFKGSPATLGAQASRTLRKARQCGMLASVLKKYECTFEHIAQCLSRCMRAQRKRAFMTKEGTIVYAELGDDCQVQLTAAKLLLTLHGAFDSKRQQELLLADVADAIAPAELEPPVEETTTEVDCDDKRSDAATPENAGKKYSLPGEARALSEAGSESGGTTTAPPPDTTASLPKSVDNNEVAGQIDDPRAILLSVFGDTHRDLLRARERQEKGETGDTSKLVRDLCMLAATISKLGSGSEGQKKPEEITRPDHLSPEEQQLELMADEMHPASRMLTGQVLESALRLAHLTRHEQQLQASVERQPTAPAEDTS
jgi:hypothetical protein